jgi:hypothetical protein
MIFVLCVFRTSFLCGSSASTFVVRVSYSFWISFVVKSNVGSFGFKYDRMESVPAARSVICFVLTLSQRIH